MPVTRSQFKLQKRPPPRERLPPKKLKRLSKEEREEVDEDFQVELEKEWNVKPEKDEDLGEMESEGSGGESEEEAEKEEEEEEEGMTEEKFALLEQLMELCSAGLRGDAVELDEGRERSVDEMYTIFSDLLESKIILSPKEEVTCTDREQLRLLELYIKFAGMMAERVNNEKIPLAIRKKAAMNLNSFSSLERGTRALKIAVRAYLSEKKRHTAFIEDLGEQLKQKPQKLTPAAQETLAIAKKVTSGGNPATDVFVTNLMSVLDILGAARVSGDAAQKITYKKDSAEAILDKLWQEIICGVDMNASGGGGETRVFPLDGYNAKRLLNRLPNRIFAVMKKPTLAADLLMTYFEHGGIFTFLSLEGIFTLMTKHHLDFPNFYQRLYASLNASFFTSKYRHVYFKFLDRFMSSTHLPDYLVRGFVKKFARLGLGAPIDAAFGLVPLILNLLIRYPTLKSLVTADCPIDDIMDPFDVNAKDPAGSNCKDSCLWEIKTLTKHAVPDVAEFALRILKQPLPTLESDISRRIDTNSDYVFRSVTNKVVPPDVAIAYQPSSQMMQFSFS